MSKESGKRSPRKPDEPMSAFGNAREDYFSHAMAEHPVASRAFFRIAIGLVGLVARLVFPSRFYGEDDFVAHVRDHGSVVVMNHVSFVETIAPIIMMWRHRIHCRPIYKQEFDRNAFLRAVLPLVGGIPIDRGRADMRAIKDAQRAIAHGECVLIFPEGTRVRNDEQRVTIHGGFSLIAQLARTDIVPMAVVGAADPYHTRPTRRKRVFFSIGTPIAFDQLTATDRKARLSEMEQVAMEQVYRMRDEMRIEHPGLW